MQNVQIIAGEHGVTRLVLQSGRGNPLTPDCLQDLNTALDQLSVNPPRALVIDANGAKIFSAGFALPIIAHWDEAKITVFLKSFMDVLFKLLRISCPTITVVEGHSIAGGFILSLASDLRIVSSSEKIKLGLSEVDLGVALPAPALVLFEARTNGQTALWYGMSGQLLSPQDALACGYAFQVSETPLEDGLALAAQLAQKPGQGTAVTRQLFNMPLIERMQKAQEDGSEGFLRTWFSPEGQQHVQALAARLMKK